MTPRSTSSTSTPLENQAASSIKANEQIKEFICPVTTDILFEPVMISGCGHLVEGRIANPLRKCPSCRSEEQNHGITIVAVPPIITSILSSTLAASPALWQQVYLDHDYLAEVLRKDELKTPTGERFIKLLENNSEENLNDKAPDGAHKGKSAIEILASFYIGRELIRGNEKIKALISEETKLVEVDGKTIAEWMTMPKGKPVLQEMKTHKKQSHQPNQSSLFANSNQPGRRIENNVWQRTVDGKENEAKAFLEANPELIFTKQTIAEHTERELDEASPFQITLRCGDVEMAEMIKRIALNRFPDGQARLDEQYNEVYPQGHAEHLREQEANTFNFDAIVNAISSAEEVDLQAALAKTNNGSILCRTLDEFRTAFDEKSLNEKVFNPNHLLKAMEIYDSRFDNWNGNQCDLFWRQIIGYTQRYLPSCYKQAFCQGLYNLTEKNPKDPLSRTETLDNWITNRSIRFANLDEDPSCRLSFDFAVYSYYTATACEAGNHAAVANVARSFQSLCRAKTAVLADLCGSPNRLIGIRAGV